MDFVFGVQIVIFHKKLKWISPKTCSDCKKVPGMLDSTSTVCMYILVSMQQQFLLLHPRTTTHELITFLIRDERERERGSFLIDVSGPTTSRISDGCDVSLTNFQNAMLCTKANKYGLFRIRHFFGEKSCESFNKVAMSDWQGTMYNSQQNY